MAEHDEKSGSLVCSFCGKSQEEVRRLIAGPTVYICDECAVLAFQISCENGGLNMRAGYYCFATVVKLLYPIAEFCRREKSN